MKYPDIDMQGTMLNKEQQTVEYTDNVGIIGILEWQSSETSEE